MSNSNNELKFAVKFTNCISKKCSKFSNFNNGDIIKKYIKKISNSKSLNTKNKYIELLFDYKVSVNKKIFECEVANCNKHIINYFKNRLENYKLKLIKIEKIPKIIRDSLIIYNNIVSKNKLDIIEYNILIKKSFLLSYYIDSL
jgi:hypothetical protein